MRSSRTGSAAQAPSRRVDLPPRAAPPPPPDEDEASALFDDDLFEEHYFGEQRFDLPDSIPIPPPAAAAVQKKVVQHAVQKAVPSPLRQPVAQRQPVTERRGAAGESTGPTDTFTRDSLDHPEDPTDEVTGGGAASGHLRLVTPLPVEERHVPARNREATPTPAQRRDVVVSPPPAAAPKAPKAATPAKAATLPKSKPGPKVDSKAPTAPPSSAPGAKAAPPARMSERAPSSPGAFGGGAFGFAPKSLAPRGGGSPGRVPVSEVSVSIPPRNELPSPVPGLLSTGRPGSAPLKPGRSPIPMAPPASGRATPIHAGRATPAQAGPVWPVAAPRAVAPTAVPAVDEGTGNEDLMDVLVDATDGEGEDRDAEDVVVLDALVEAPAPAPISAPVVQLAPNTPDSLPPAKNLEEAAPDGGWVRFDDDVSTGLFGVEDSDDRSGGFDEADPWQVAEQAAASPKASHEVVIGVDLAPPAPKASLASRAPPPTPVEAPRASHASREPSSAQPSWLATEPAPKVRMRTAAELMDHAAGVRFAFAVSRIGLPPIEAHSGPAALTTRRAELVEGELKGVVADPLPTPPRPAGAELRPISTPRSLGLPPSSYEPDANGTDLVITPTVARSASSARTRPRASGPTRVNWQCVATELGAWAVGFVFTFTVGGAASVTTIVATVLSSQS